MYQRILQFWFTVINPSQWRTIDSEFDKRITNDYKNLHARAHQSERYQWRETARGSLTEIIMLDQLLRNMYRGLPIAFASGPLALGLAQQAIFASADAELCPVERSFLYRPFMHGESVAIHKMGIELYEKDGIESNYKFALKHKAIIDRFGRYPHRNKTLGRSSTPR